MRVREAKDNEVIYDPNYPDAVRSFLARNLKKGRGEFLKIYSS